MIEFLINQANKIEGLAYSGFETFRGSPYTSCARETGQNSRDAAVNPDIPVRVEFNLHSIPRQQLPFADQLQHSIRCCLDDCHDDKTRLHLERALKTITAPTVKVLEISDYNTTGLTGPTDDAHSVFAALVKGDGVTQKADPTSAGSYGIGKNAAYAVSDLQTVIYSTCWKDPQNGASVFAAQGRLRLISHTDGNRKYSAEGYWGNAGFRAVEAVADVPEWVRRSELGTTILSVGFREQDHWIARMSLSLVTNFFLAIERREIEFSVGNGNTALNHSSLDHVLNSAELNRAAEESDQLEILERAKRLLRCVRSETTTKTTISIEGLGEFTLYVLVAEQMPREVHVLRNGIYITDNFSKFGQKLERFPGTREFTAVLEPARSKSGDGPSRLLKRLENPAHDAFEPERIVDKREQELARRQIKELIGKVRAVIRQTASITDLEQSQLDELSHLFANGGRDPNTHLSEGEADPESFRYGIASPTSRERPRGLKGSGGHGSGLGSDGGQKKRNLTGKSAGTNKRAGSREDVPLSRVRSTIPDGGDGHHRRIHFTAPIDGEIELRVDAAGLSSDSPVRIMETSAGYIQGGRLRSVVSAGERVTIDVTFAESFKGPIELTAVDVSPSSAET